MLPAVSDGPLPAGAVSWSAILAGAAAAGALSLILLMLGTGLGFSIVSPWARGVSATTLGLSSILWLTLTQLLASGMGGYIAGRLRAKWPDIHSDEAFFRDTAHGFLAWGVATLVTAALLTTVIAGIVGGGAQLAAGMAMADHGKTPTSYFVDSLLRKASASPTALDKNATATTADQARTAAEVSVIFLHALPASDLPLADVHYVGQLVAQRSGLAQDAAEQRVRDAYTGLQTSAEKARKTSAYVSLWLFISLLIGAFVASLAATCGGRCRDTN